MSYKLQDFSFDLRKCTSHPDHIFVGSGYSTCSPLTFCTCGVGSLYSPPFSAGDMQFFVSFEANGHHICDNGNLGKGDCGVLYQNGYWYPQKVVRSGTYHFKVQDQLISFLVTSELVPLFSHHGKNFCVLW